MTGPKRVISSGVMARPCAIANFTLAPTLNAHNPTVMISRIVQWLRWNICTAAIFGTTSRARFQGTELWTSSVRNEYSFMWVWNSLAKQKKITNTWTIVAGGLVVRSDNLKAHFLWWIHCLLCIFHEMNLQRGQRHLATMPVFTVPRIDQFDLVHSTVDASYFTYRK